MSNRIANPPGTSTLKPKQRKIVAAYEALTPKAKAVIEDMLRTLPRKAVR